MTQKEIDAAKKMLPRLFDYQSWTPQQKILNDELDCREMINSCLCYGAIKDFWRVFDDFFGRHSYADPFIKALGRERVEELVAEQESDFAKAQVSSCVYTDSEGLIYNSIQWADD